MGNMEKDGKKVVSTLGASEKRESDVGQVCRIQIQVASELDRPQGLSVQENSALVFLQRGQNSCARQR